MGLTEETDAIAIVVSEETGTISISTRGRLSRDFDEERLRKFLSGTLVSGQTSNSRWNKIRHQLDLTATGVPNPENQEREGGAHGG